MPKNNYEVYRTANLYKLNLPLRDHNPKFPQESLLNGSLREAVAGYDSPRGLSKDKSLGSLQNLHD